MNFIIFTDTSAEQNSDSKKLCYLGDFSDNDMKSPSKACRVLQIAKRNITEKKRIINKLRCRKKRLRKRISDFEEILGEHRGENLISDSAS